jgi:hypothetical protein
MNISVLKNKPVGTLASILAGSAAALAAAPASATIISDTTPFSVGSSTPVGAMTGVTIGNSFAYNSDKNFDSYRSDYLSITSGTGGVAGVVSAGTLIGPTSLFSQQADVGIHQASFHWYFGTVFDGYSNSGGGSGLYGVSFNSGAGLRYGWLDVAITDNGEGYPFSATVNGYGYENSGAAIAAGAVAAAAPVPEPETLTMMAFGLMGLAAARRRQRSAQARRAH